MMHGQTKIKFTVIRLDFSSCIEVLATSSEINFSILHYTIVITGIMTSAVTQILCVGIN